MGEFWAPGAEIWLFKKKNMDRSIDLAVWLMYHAMHTGDDYGGTKTNFLEVNSTNFLDVYDELFKVLWIESFIVFVLTSVHQVKGR